jgi:hypothetical protein
MWRTGRADLIFIISSSVLLVYLWKRSYADA